jgi:hypothetical protein
MPTGYDISDIRYENIVLRDKISELEEENDKLYEELAEKTTPRYEMVAYTLFVIMWAMVAGIALQATF